jgi:hypothetical protein
MTETGFRDSLVINGALITRHGELYTVENPVLETVATVETLQDAFTLAESYEIPCGNLDCEMCYPPEEDIYVSTASNQEKRRV